MNATLKTIAFATLVAGAIALAGCTSTPAPTPTTAATTATVSPAPSETSAPAASGAVGDILDPAAAAALNAAVRTAGDDRAYQLPDGTFVLVKYGQPLPESVQAAVEATVKQSQTEDFNSPDPEAQGVAMRQVLETVKAQGAATAKQYIVVSHLLSYVDATASWVPAWGLTEGNYGPQDSYEAAMSLAQKWVDASPQSRGIIYLDTLG